MAIARNHRPLFRLFLFSLLTLTVFGSEPESPVAHGDEREELIIWDPTATEVFIDTQPADRVARDRHPIYQPGPRQYNARIMN